MKKYIVGLCIGLVIPFLLLIIGNYDLKKKTLTQPYFMLNDNRIYLINEEDTFKVAVRHENFTVIGRKWIIKHCDPMGLNLYEKELKRITNEKKHNPCN